MPTRPDSEVSSQGRRRFLTTTAISIAAASAANAMVSAVSGARAISAQDKYTVRLPNGLAFSEFRGFEDWPTVAVSQAGDLIEVIVRQSPDGQGLLGRRSRQWQDLPGRSKMAKIHWKSKRARRHPTRRQCRTPCTTSISW